MSTSAASAGSTGIPGPAPSSLKRYWLATRPYSYTAAIVPASIGSLVAVLTVKGLGFGLLPFVLTILGCVAIQAVANVVNDIFDARTGIDRPDNYGRLNAIVSGLVTEREAKMLVLVASGISGIIGLWAIARVGTPMIGLILLGAALAFFYTAPPFRLKFWALGGAAVAAGFGVGMVFGSFLIQAAPRLGGFPFPLGQILVYALPSHFLVVGILHANNHCDRAADRAAGARTVANVLSHRASAMLNTINLLAPHAIVLLAVVTGLAVPYWLIVGLSLPIALKLSKRGLAGDVEGMYVPEFAKLHGLFGILTTLALLVGIWRS